MKPAPFILPKRIAPGMQVDFCIRVINQYRQELIPLRRNITDAIRWQDYWRDKAQKYEEELVKTKRENERLKKEKEHLKQEIEKLTKSNHRCRMHLFDHGNFIDPQTSKKKKGGQQEHPDTNRETDEDYNQWQRHRLFAKTCAHCGTKLPRVTAVKQKILIDLALHPDIIRQIITSERQWCGRCQKEVIAKDERSLPFTEYGINTVMTILLLRFRGKTSLTTISSIFSVFGLPLAPSAISNLLTQTKQYLRGRYEELKTAVRDGDVLYQDETGWLIRGEKAWLWIMANEDTTVYHAGISRGKGNAEELYGSSAACSMHDEYAAYTNTIPKDKHLYCWAHLLRFAHEEAYGEEKESEVIQVKDELVSCYHLKETLTGKTLKKQLTQRFTALVKRKTTALSAQKIQNRVRKQKEGLIRALLVTPDGTNNLSERELRPLVIARKTSNGSDTFSGMETTAILASVIQTAWRKKKHEFLQYVQQDVTNGVHRLYPQYCHQSYSDP